MPQRVSLRQLDSRSFHVHEAYDADDNLITTDVEVQSEADYQELRDRNVRYVILTKSDREESSEQPSDPDEPAPGFSPTDPDTETGSVTVQDTRETYRALLDRVESIFTDFHRGVGNLDDLEELKPVLDDFLTYVRKNPASISILTQIEDYDDITFNHSINTCIFSIVYGDRAGFGKNRLFDLAFGSLLHDFGKTRLPLSLIRKDGELSDSEFEDIKRHPEEGRKLLEKFDSASVAWKIAYEHHERPDGSGYPRGVEDIHPDSRIVSVIDAYEALTAPRPYKSPVLPAKAFLVMKEEFYSHDVTRDIWNNLIRCMGLFSIGSFVRLNNGMIGVVEQNNPEDLAKPVVKVILDQERGRIEEPFSVDLHRVKDQKRMVANYVFDESTEIEKAISLEEFSHLKPKIRALIDQQDLTLGGSD